MFDLYTHIESLGKQRGYKNITALCSAAGVPRANMTELKMGRSKDLSKPTAQKFADLLGISLNELYGIEQKENPAAHSDEVEEYLQAVHDRPELKVLFKKGKNATKEQLAAILALLPDNDEN